VAAAVHRLGGARGRRCVRFVRVHRSHIVQLTHVTSIEPYDERRLFVRMADGSDLVASRQGSKVLRALME
jgi:two-component system LytT family response regulator